MNRLATACWNIPITPDPQNSGAGKCLRYFFPEITPLLKHGEKRRRSNARSHADPTYKRAGTPRAPGASENVEKSRVSGRYANMNVRQSLFRVEFIGRFLFALM